MNSLGDGSSGFVTVNKSKLPPVIFPEVRGTYRATYEISGNTITFINAEYEATSNGFDSYDDFASMPNQVSNAVNDYFTDQYKLDKITVCV